MHGGLSPGIMSVDDIRIIPRNQEIPPTGTLADLLWSDPD